MTTNAVKEPGLWSHDVPNQSPALVIISTVFLLVTTLFFGLRVKERWQRRPHDSDGLASIGTKIRVLLLSDDAMATAAYITLFVQTVFGGMAAHYGNDRNRDRVCPGRSHADCIQVLANIELTYSRPSLKPCSTSSCTRSVTSCLGASQSSRSASFT